MKNVFKLALYGIAAGALSMSVAFAVPDEEAPEKRGEGARGGRPDPAARFAAADTDGNGTINLEEFKASHKKRMAAMKERRGDRPPREGRTPPSAEDIFKRLDKDGNGELTKEEMRAGRRGARGGQGGGPRGGQGGGQGGGPRGGQGPGA